MDEPAALTAGTRENRGPKVLVLMATFDGSRWLAEQLRTIREQRAVTPTVLVCDDDSSDTTLSVLEQARRTDPSVHLHLSRDRGGSAARNFIRLIREASVGGALFVALSDQDDQWDSDKLARAVQALSVSGAGAYSAAVRVESSRRTARVLRQSSRITNADHLFEGAGQGCTFVFSATAFGALQQALRELGNATNDVHYHDWLLYALARTLGIAWYFDPHPSMSYRQHASNDTGARGSWAAIRLRVGHIRSGWYAKQIAHIARICQQVRPEMSAPRKVLYLLNHASFAVRCQMASYVIFHGRRKWRDTFVLIVSALAGWLTVK